MPTDFTIEMVDVHAGDESVLRSYHEAQVENLALTEPEEPPTSYERQLKGWRNHRSDQKPLHWVALDGDRVVGYATLPLEYTETNRHLSWVDVGVRPDARRRRIGTALLRTVADAASDDGRTMLGCGTVEGHPGEDFAEAHGFVKKLTERKSRLDLTKLDRAQMESWVAAADSKAPDYELFRQDEPAGDDLVAALAALYEVTNTAPRDDYEMDDEVMTAERWREREEVQVKNEITWWRLIARQKSTGALAGFTEFWFSPDSPDIAWQGWTAVDPAHRNHGIGRWLKAANVLRLLDERPQYRYNDTWNAFSNGPMLKINIDMGYELVRAYNEWQAPVDTILALSKERLGG